MPPPPPGMGAPPPVSGGYGMPPPGKGKPLLSLYNSTSLLKNKTFMLDEML